MEKLVFIGSGTHFHSVIDSFQNDYEVVGVLDNLDEQGSLVDGYPVLGGFALIPTLKEQGINHVFISVGDVGLRKKLLIECKNYDLKLITIIDRSAIVSSRASIRSGVFVGKGAIINAHASIDKAVIINSGAIIEHDANIGFNTHIAPNATICGSVTIGDHVFVGAGSVVIPGITVGKEAIIGANTTVIHDVAYQAKVAGSPARNI